MPSSRLTRLQQRVLELLGPIDPPWTLTGGGALVGFHLGHRTTRDLDLFWHGASALGPVPDHARERLESAGLEVEVLHRAESFHKLRVTDGDDVVVVELVADPVATVEEPTTLELGGARILVDTEHEILVNKLCALLSRSELRDLIDVGELVAAGGDLRRALSDAPRKDGGFSPLTLAWTLRELPVPSLAAAAGCDEAGIASLEASRDELVARCLDASAPGRDGAGSDE